MTSNQLMTGAAIGFAGFALWWITRTPGNQVSAQPGQAARDAGLQQWLNTIDAQYVQLGLQSDGGLNYEQMAIAGGADIHTHGWKN